MNNNVYVAKLGKTVGLKGHLRLFIDSDFPEQFKKDAVFITNKKLLLKVVEYSNSKNLIKFEDYDNLDIAKKLINQELYVSQEETRQNCRLKENEYFWFDLENCKIYEDDKYLGIVNQVLRYPLNDYLEIKTSDKFLKQEKLAKTFLIPYIFDDFILEVDIDTKSIKVKNSYDILENS